MSLFWLSIVSLHILAAVSWIGGMVFLSLVLAPLVRTESTTPDCTALFRSAALRFRIVVWAAMAVLLTTGPILLSERHLAVTNPATWPWVVAVKLGLVAGLILSTLSHDLFLGPKVGQVSALPECSRTAWEQSLVRWARWLPRFSLLLALAVIVMAVALVRS